MKRILWRNSLGSAAFTVAQFPPVVPAEVSLKQERSSTWNPQLVSFSEPLGLISLDFLVKVLNF